MPFSCWMRMIRSQINVYDDIKDKPKVVRGVNTQQQRQMNCACCAANEDVRT